MKTKPVPYQKRIVVLPTSASKKEIAELRAANYIPICCDDPSKVAVLMPVKSIYADDLLMSALHGMSALHSTNERAKMVEEFTRRLLAKETKPQPPTV
jgi:hypothetical protein